MWKKLEFHLSKDVVLLRKKIEEDEEENKLQLVDRMHTILYDEFSIICSNSLRINIYLYV